ncbi:ROK family transcriptional regulator [Microbispora sp. RL4-1S]|uniref:ROK family transcriptional regulator n=1 Tax=Microbispora oryzae TaxID=2806554 RepID=A0A940WFT9_9ACTN|nr:ROK family transcriptional regulator [Microbispora oryzae]MBP2704735.1 ROK family transcriptional regulator [Microbispora oryzae]
MRTATPRLARAINDRVALDLLLERGPLTAPQLREITGLSRPTVSDLIERLQAEGLIRVAGETGGDRRGPNARLYGLVAERAHVGGVDIRRDVVNVTVADIAGEPVGSATRPVDPRDLPGLVAATLAEAAGARPLHTVVVGAPGLVDPGTGDLSEVNDMPGWRPDLRTALERVVGVPVIIENEVNLAAVAEHQGGVAAGRDDFVLLWLDDGVGAAVMLGGRLRRGVSGGAGELGYLSLSGTLACDLLAEEALHGLDTGALAGRVAECAFTMVAVLDPGLVVLAGGTSRAGGAELAAEVERRLSAVSPVPVEVRMTEIADNPVLRGAVHTALASARDEVFGGAAR